MQNKFQIILKYICNLEYKKGHYYNVGLVISPTHPTCWKMFKNSDEN